MIELNGSNIGMYFCDDMDTAAELAVKLAKEYKEKREAENKPLITDKFCDADSKPVVSKPSPVS